MSKGGILRFLLPPRDEKFFAFFENGADICCEAARLFNEIIDLHINDDRFARAMMVKEKSADIAKETLNELNRTFVTPLDREDILHISFLLNKISKRIVRGCVNLKVYRMPEYPGIMKRQADVLVKATDELRASVALLKELSNLKKVTESNHRMVEIEHHGDDVFSNAMEDLFSGKHEALDVIKLRDIYRDIESALDNCFNVSDTIVNMALKNA